MAYRWYRGLGIEYKVLHHSTFSVNRLGRFRENYILRKVFDEVVGACMKAGLVGGESFRRSHLSALRRFLQLNMP